MASSKKSSDDRLAYGLTIMIFGVLFLLDKTGVLAQIPYASGLVNTGSLFLIAGIIFLSVQTEKVIGFILSSIGIVILSNLFFAWMRGYTNLIVPVILIVAGLIVILTAKK